MNSTSKHIHALLFISGTGLPADRMQKILSIKKEEFEIAIHELETSLVDSGVMLTQHAGTYTLSTSPETADILNTYLREELENNLSRSALETLAIILYKGPVTRSAIEYIRGVSSTYAIQTLLTRGLIDRKEHPKDARSYLYEPSHDFLKYAGVSSLAELPKFEELSTEKNEEIHEAAERIKTNSEHND